MLIILLRKEKMYDEIEKLCNLTLNKKLGTESNCISYIGKAYYYDNKESTEYSSIMYIEALKLLDALLKDKAVSQLIVDIS